MSNDLVILVCGVILLVAVLPMILMSRAFKGAGSRKDTAGADGTPILVDPGSAHLGAGKAKTGQGADDSGGFNDAGSYSGGGDGGGGGE